MFSSTLLHGLLESFNEVFNKFIIGLPNVEVTFWVEVVVDRVRVNTFNLVSLSFALSADCLDAQLVISLLFVIRDGHFRVPLHRLPALELWHLQIRNARTEMGLKYEEWATVNLPREISQWKMRLSLCSSRCTSVGTWGHSRLPGTCPPHWHLWGTYTRSERRIPVHSRWR